MNNERVDSLTSLSVLLYRVGHHDYEPQYTVSMDAIGLDNDAYSLRLQWVCRRCGDEITLQAGVFPG
jgi:hypothetical protein